MASTTTPTAVRGLLIHDPRLGAADITATDTAGGHPSITRPTSDALSVAILEATGDSDGVSRTIHTIQGGNATPGAAARIGWSTDGTAATERGAFGRRVMTGYELFELSSASYAWPIVAITNTGRCVVVYYNGTKIVSKFRDIDDETAGTYGLYTWSAGGDVTTSGGTPGAMVVLPDTGRMLLWVRSSATYGSTSYTTFDLYYSDSEGTTWTLGQVDVGIRTTLTVDSLHVVRHGAYLTAVMRQTSTACASWYSLDRGQSFIAVDASAAWSSSASQCIVACDDGSVVLFYVDGSGNLLMSRKRSPVAAFATDPSFGTTLQSTTYGATQVQSLTACIDHDGLIAVFSRGTSDNTYRLLRCRQDISGTSGIIQDYYGDDGLNLEPAYTGSGATDYLRLFILFAWRDALYVTTLNGGATVFSGVLRLGGWASVGWDKVCTFGRLNPGTTVAGRAWFGSLDPANCAWSLTGAGTVGTSAFGGWSIATTANTAYYVRNGSATGNVIVVLARLRVASGGALTSDDIAIRLIQDTGAGSNRYNVSLRFSGTGIRMYDNNGAATVGSDASGLTSGNYVDVLFTMNGSRVASYYKAPTATLWTLGPYGTATAAATGSTNQVIWGNIASGTATSHWAFLLSAADDRVQAPSITEPNTARPTNGRELSSRPIWLQNNIYIRARSTPVLTGETFTIGTTYDYGALDPVSRPGIGEQWRSTADSAEVTVTWTYDNTSGGNVAPWSPSVGLCLREANFRTFYFEGYDGSSWTTLVTGDTCTGMSSLEFARVGYVLAPSGSPVGTRYAQADAYAGGYAILVSGTTQVVKLEGNRAGTWAGTSTGPGLVLMIDRTTDLTGIHASGTIHLIPPLFVALCHTVTTAYRAYRLRISAQDTAENYFKMRPPIMGSFVVFGRQYSIGRLVGPILSQETTDLRGGARRTRMVSRPKRYAELGWNDPIPGGGTGGVWGATPTPNGVAIYNSVPVALDKDPAMLEGILQIARGGQQPVVYLPSILTGSATTQISARELILPGTIVGEGGARTHVGGRSENDDEVDTLGTLRIDEIP